MSEKQLLKDVQFWVCKRNIEIEIVVNICLDWRKIVDCPRKQNEGHRNDKRQVLQGRQEGWAGSRKENGEFRQKNGWHSGFARRYGELINNTETDFRCWNQDKLNFECVGPDLRVLSYMYALIVFTPLNISKYGIFVFQRISGKGASLALELLELIHWESTLIYLHCLNSNWLFIYCNQFDDF